MLPTSVLRSWRRHECSTKGVAKPSAVSRPMLPGNVLERRHVAEVNVTGPASQKPQAPKLPLGKLQDTLPRRAANMLMSTAAAASGGERGIDCRAFVLEHLDSDVSRRYDFGNTQLGAGGSGNVFIAHDRGVPGRRVAIKRVKVTREGAREGFQTEVQTMKELVHPNICKLFETYDEGPLMFLVMELCEGGEVFDRVMEQGLIAEFTSASLIQQVASALKYAHGKNIAHRDLKPENICFSTADKKDDHIKVIDWGVSFHFGLRRMRTAVGSMTYMAPEVLQGGCKAGYTSACDLWGLGVVTYTLLCGSPPFWGSGSEMMNHMREEDLSMTDLTWQSISEDAKDFIRGLLKFNPGERLSIDGAVKHPWLRNQAHHPDPLMSQKVLSNLRRFSNTSRLYSLCMASASCQLDNRSLRDVEKVFREMDSDGDGVLTLAEVKSAFERTYPADSEEMLAVEDMFARLDLDGSGEIDYVEFCAANIGVRASREEELQALHAAFKTFDTSDHGEITKDEFQATLDNSHTGRSSTRMTTDMFNRFDKDGNGALDFNEWLNFIQASSLEMSP